MSKHLVTEPEVVPASWRSFVVACRKCGKKLGGGFGPDRDETLGRCVKQALRAKGQRQALRVVETGCLGLCPKRAVAVMRADRPGELLAIPCGTETGELLVQLGVHPA